MKQAQLPNANTNPSGWAASWITVSNATPPTVRARAAALRRVRAPAAASTIVPRNSIAPTVASGSRAMAR